MTIRLHLWRGAFARAVLLTLITTLVPLPLAAADNAKAPAKASPSLREAVSNIAPRDLAAIQATPLPARSPAPRRSQQGSNPATQSGSFFKTTGGIVVLAALGAGIGYALYSTQHDRVSSPGKK